MTYDQKGNFFGTPRGEFTGTEDHFLHYFFSLNRFVSSSLNLVEIEEMRSNFGEK